MLGRDQGTLSTRTRPSLVLPPPRDSQLGPRSEQRDQPVVAWLLPPHTLDTAAQ